MKIFGLACGRKMDNTEILVKEALMAAEELGASVNFLRLIDLDVKPCRGCGSCLKSLFEGGEGKCVINDNLPLLDEQIMECDGLILGSPVLTGTPSALLKALVERFAPSHDNIFRMEAKKINATKQGIKGPDERSFKNRAGAFISAGGGLNYVAMAVPLMNYLTYPMGIEIVDQMPLAGLWYGSAGIIERADILERARKLARNVVDAINRLPDKIKWMGDEPGTCPVCHSNLLIVTNHNPVECPICGIKGQIKISGNEINVIFPEEEIKNSRFSIKGKLDHWHELQSFANKTGQVELKPETAKKLEKYRGYLEKK